MYVYLREYKDPKQFFVDTISVTNAHYTYTPISNFFVVRTYIRALADTHTHTHNACRFTYTIVYTRPRDTEQSGERSRKFLIDYHYYEYLGKILIFFSIIYIYVRRISCDVRDRNENAYFETVLYGHERYTITVWVLSRVNGHTARTHVPIHGDVELYRVILLRAYARVFRL